MSIVGDSLLWAGRDRTSNNTLFLKPIPLCLMTSVLEGVGIEKPETRELMSGVCGSACVMDRGETWSLGLSGDQPQPIALRGLESFFPADEATHAVLDQLTEGAI